MTHEVGYQILKKDFKEACELILKPRPGGKWGGGKLSFKKKEKGWLIDCLSPLDRADFENARIQWQETRNPEQAAKMFPRAATSENAVLRSYTRFPNNHKKAILSVSYTHVGGVLSWLYNLTFYSSFQEECWACIYTHINHTCGITWFRNASNDLVVTSHWWEILFWKMPLIQQRTRHQPVVEVVVEVAVLAEGFQLWWVNMVNQEFLGRDDKRHKKTRMHSTHVCLHDA